MSSQHVLTSTLRPTRVFVIRLKTRLTKLRMNVRSIVVVAPSPFALLDPIAIP